MSTVGTIAPMPGNRAASVATCRAAAAASSAFDGTQPVFTQVPPIAPASTITTCRPKPSARIAAAKPAAPEPITARLQSIPLVVTSCRLSHYPDDASMNLPRRWNVKR